MNIKRIPVIISDMRENMLFSKKKKKKNGHTQHASISQNT